MKSTLSVTEFKAHALEGFKAVSTKNQTLIVTKWGKPIARVVPYQEKSKSASTGRLAHLLVEEHDVISPLGAELWSASK